MAGTKARGLGLVKVLVTGATGFVGQALVKKLLQDGCELTALVRAFSNVLPDNVGQVVTGDLANLTCRSPAARLRQNGKSDTDGVCTGQGDRGPGLKGLEDTLHNIDVLIHTAARAHVMNDHQEDSLKVFRKINTEATLELARMAAKAGVKRFVFLSSIGVNGAVTDGRPFTEQDEPAPHNDYALSKWEAEQGLQQLVKETKMEVVIIRPPLIYGPGAPGNFRTLLIWARKSVPLPFAKVNNRRSFLALENLLSFISLAITHPRAANETFLLADECDVSTSDLLKAVADAFDVPSRLFYLPARLFYLLARMTKREHMFKQLWGSLEVDTTKACAQLGWQPVVTMSEQLRQIVDDENTLRSQS